MTWTPPPALVEKVAREIEAATVAAMEDSNIIFRDTAAKFVAARALAASSLGDAVELLRRVEKALEAYILRYEAGRMNIGFEYVSGRLVVEARALLASLDATEGTKS